MIGLILAGFISGIISGMGIGGGTILIPALTIFARLSQHIAQGINLMYFIPTALSALYIHFKNKTIDFKTAIPLICFGISGAVAGALLSVKMPPHTLRKFFAVFLFIMGMYEIFKKDKI